MTYDTRAVAARHKPFTDTEAAEGASSKNDLTGCWGDAMSVSSYLNRCQVDTPEDVVRTTWQQVRKLRPGHIGKVLDLGAGDGRFARLGSYGTYVGYEIDPDRCSGARLPQNATLLNRCAFSDLEADADVCVGNPPFVRFQDIPTRWREQAHRVVMERTSVRVSGLANAWQYFFLHALASLKSGGLAALIVPFEWVSRPSAKSLRAYIREHKWNVYVHRLRDEAFARVLTTASITIVDKAAREAKWEFHNVTRDGANRQMASPTGSSSPVLAYRPATDLPSGRPQAKRGLSPGTQNALTLTEEQRKAHSLRPERDVAACITSLRNLPNSVNELDKDVFQTHFVNAGRRCWLIRTDQSPSVELNDYISSIPASDRQTKTCLSRTEWWKFKMPISPCLLFAQGFRGKFPKVVKNTLGAHAVGAVCGIYNASEEQIQALTGKLCGMDLRDHVVPYSSGFYKIEINQINALLATLTAAGDG